MKTFALLALTGTLSLAQAQDKNPISDQFFRILPESQSLMTFGLGSDRALNPQSIKTLVWNIKKGELSKWPSEFMQYAQNRDLLLIQEAYRSPVFDETLLKFGENRWNMGISFIYRRKGNTPTGTMVGSYVQPSQIVVKHSTDNEPFIDTPKALTMVKYPVVGKNDELLVISIHAINFTATAPFKRHVDLAAKEIASHRGPVLFAGDFNTWNKARTTYLFGLVKKLGLQEIPLKNADARLKFAGYPLDHGFQRGLQIKSAEVIPESKGSDHRPILLEAAVL